MRKFRELESREQILLLPPSIDDYVSGEDMVRYLDRLVNELDLSQVEDRFSFIGRPAYSPIMLIKVILYGKFRGMRSSRELAVACRENLRFIFLAQNEKPDFRTISEFRRKHIDLLGSLLKQTVMIGIEEGVIDLKHVAVDGTKIRANASGKSFKEPAELEKLLEALQASLSDDIKFDEKEDDDHGNDDGEPKLPKHLRDKKRLEKHIKASLKEYESREKDEKTGRISKTDNDARFMKGPEGKRPYYNAQMAMDEKGRMVVGARITNAGSDHGELAEMVKEVKETAGRNPDKMTADKGYRATEGLVALEEHGIEGFIPLQKSSGKRISQDHFIYDAAEDEYICPEGRSLYFIGEKHPKSDIYESEDCSGCSRQRFCIETPQSRRTLKVSQDIGTIERMKARMESEIGKQMSRARSMTVELGFAWLKIHRKLRQFMFRTLETVDQEWRFEAVGLNVARLVSERMKRARCYA